MQLEAESKEQLDELYPSIKPYKTRPSPSSIAVAFLKRLAERNDWIPTRELHDIYHSMWGTHVNLLIKLAKSGYVETAKVKDVTGKRLQTVETRYWRITDKGRKLLNRLPLTDEELFEYNKRRLKRYCEKQGAEVFVVDDVAHVTCKDGRVIEVLLTKPVKWQYVQEQIRWHCRDRKDRIRLTPEERQLLKEAEQWLEEHPELKTSIQTPIGIIAVEGDLMGSHFTLNGEFICIQPDKPLHWTDVYIWRLQMLNWYTDQLVDTIVRAHLLRRCRQCDNEFSMYGQNWRYCPMCGAKIDEQVREYVRKAKLKWKSLS